MWQEKKFKTFFLKYLPSFSFQNQKSMRTGFVKRNWNHKNLNDTQLINDREMLRAGFRAFLWDRWSDSVDALAFGLSSLLELWGYWPGVSPTHTVPTGEMQLLCHSQPGRLSRETQHLTLGALSPSPYTLCEPAISGSKSPVQIPQAPATLTGQGKLDRDKTESWALNQQAHLSQETLSTVPNKL